jgi:hypothetical protein
LGIVAAKLFCPKINAPAQKIAIFPYLKVKARAPGIQPLCAQAKADPSLRDQKAGRLLRMTLL